MVYKEDVIYVCEYCNVPLLEDGTHYSECLGVVPEDDWESAKYNWKNRATVKRRRLGRSIRLKTGETCPFCQRYRCSREYSECCGEHRDSMEKKK